jgi:hypothetical protein
VKLRTLVKV